MLPAGERIGAYEIVGPLGAGGMGEVYRARDSRLKRDVALKVLPEALATDPGRMARFQREAEVLASLNHPNIAHIYGVEDRALVMELAEGGSPQGPLPFDDAWKIASQIADALEYAHERGIVHRDLKPANIKVTPEGVVKLLDFGLAKAMQDEPQAEGRAADSPTLTMGATLAGVILGTAAYMAPEQAKGKQVDKRADIWAFGVVFYELLTGRQLFRGEDVADTLAHVLTQRPDWEPVPARARRLLEECLQKDPKLRLRDIGDARRLLGEETASAAATSRWSKVPWAAATVLAAIAGAISLIHFREQPPPRPELVRFTIVPPEKSSFVAPGSPSISPDGRRVLFNAQSDTGNRLWVRSLDSTELRPVNGSEGATGTPFWSADSRWIIFSAQGRLKKAEVAGGPAQTLCEIRNPAFGGFSTPDNRIVFGGPPGVQQVPAQGGALSQVTIPDRDRGEQGHVNPSLLPDGVHFLYTRYAPSGATTGIYIGSLIVKPEQQESTRLLPDLSSARYAPAADPSSGGGFLLFARGTTLMAQPFNAARRELAGEAVPIQEQLTVTEGVTAGFSLSSTGSMVFRVGQSSDRQLSWYDRQGRTAGTAWVPGQYIEMALSPDASRVAVVRGELNGNTDIYVFELAGGRSTRLTTTADPNINPVWSARGDKILYSNHAPRGSLLLKSADGAGGEEAILKFNRPGLNPTSWSRDGRFLISTDANVKTKRDLWVVNMDGEHKSEEFLQTQFSESSAEFSPEPAGPRYVAYVSDESGRDEVYVTTFPDPSRGKWTISTGGGSQPRWRRDGKELLYFTTDGKLMSVDVTLNPAFKPGTPRQILQAPLFTGGNLNGQRRWDPTLDGQRFLVITSPNEVASPIMVVLNWQSLLKK